MSQKSHDGRSQANAGVPAINIADDGAGGQSSAVLGGGVTHESTALKALVARHPFTLKPTLASDAAKRPADEASDGNLAADSVRDPVAATVSIPVDGRPAAVPAATAMPNIQAALPGF